MKKILVIMILCLLCGNVKGQELQAKKGEDGKWGFVDKTGATVIPFKYDNILRFSEGLAAVKLDHKWGFIDKTGKEIIPFKYDDAGQFSEGLAHVGLNGKWGFIDKTGKEIIPLKYDNAEDFYEGLAPVKLNGKWGYVDPSGKEVIPLKYDGTVGFYKGVAMVNLNGKNGCIDKTGKEIIPFKYDNAGYFSEGLAPVKLNGKYGFIDKTGKEIIPLKYDFAGSFSKGLAAVELNGKWGFIDKTGKEIIFLKYDNAGNFGEGLANVYLDGKWGYIDKTEKEIIPFKYDRASNFVNGLAHVELNGKWGVIDKTGKEVIPLEYFHGELYEQIDTYLASVNSIFSLFAKEYIEPKINKWQKKGEFEKTADWQKRVNESTRQEKINEYLKESEQEYLSRMALKITYYELTLEEYDADNESFLTEDKKFGQLLIAVPLSEAPQFKENWHEAEKIPKYYIENDRIALEELAFKMPDGKIYKHSNQHTIKHVKPNIEYIFDPIEIEAVDNSTGKKGEQDISTVNLNVGKSDVDINIPDIDGAKNAKTYAVIIANETYRRESKVEFAASDGATFSKYCIQTLGLPKQNVRLVANATLNDIRAEINWISDVAKIYKNEVKIIFYYAGHGIPAEDLTTSYLLPVDGYGSDVRTGYKLDDLYQTLGALPAQSIIVFMDACFSGAQRSGEMLASARGVAIKTEQGKPSGNMVVFSAAQGDETAYPYREKGHGLFTYFLLKKLQESKGEVTLEELGNYITTNVRQQSIVVNRKSQTPTVIPSPSLMDWQNRKLK